MSVEQELVQVRVRVAELEARVQFLYEKLNMEYVPQPNFVDDPKVVEMIKKGNKIEAIRIYRETHSVGLAEAKTAVEEIQARLGL